ncbi:hypothetical protein DFH27DRAFT_599827 [Peziza echinospora]|nr:hypothetical protein DFH27DRAFT_599827 [Peziza echinospora]
MFGANTTIFGGSRQQQQQQQQQESDNPNLAPLGNTSRFQGLASTTPAAPPPITPVRASWAQSFMARNTGSGSGSGVAATPLPSNSANNAPSTAPPAGSSSTATTNTTTSSFFDQLLRESAEIVEGTTTLQEQQQSALKPRKRVQPTFVGPVFGGGGTGAGVDSNASSNTSVGAQAGGAGRVRRTFVYGDGYQLDVDVDCCYGSMILSNLVAIAMICSYVVSSLYIRPTTKIDCSTPLTAIT